MKPEIKAIFKKEFVECKVSKIAESGAVTALPLPDRDGKIDSKEYISPVFPVFNLGSGSVKAGDTIIVFSAKSNIRTFYYLPINLAVPIIENEIVFSENSNISFDGSTDR